MPPPLDPSMPPPLGSGDGQPPRRPGQMPAASWGWAAAFIGLVVGFGPMLALSLIAQKLEQATPVQVQITTGIAVALVVQQLVFYGWQAGVAWFLSLRPSKSSLAAWGFVKPTRAFLWVIPAALALVYVVIYAHEQIIHPEQQEILKLFPRTTGGIVLLVILTVVLAPLFEELFFRGFLFRGLANSWGWPLGALISAIAFGCAHLQLSLMIPLVALGFLLALAYRLTGSLWTSIAFHALFNLISVVAWVVAK